MLRLPRISFPVFGGGSYSNSYLAPRDGGSRPHLGTDIFARKGTPVVAVADGVVERLGENPVSGLYVVVRHSNGWRSAYVHLNDDSPGTDNGLAHGFGPGVRVGAEVTTGTVLGYVGDSGNAETTAPHLHFELRQPNGFKANPYPALRKARRPQVINHLPSVDYGLVASDNTGLISHHDPGSGFNGDIAVVDDHLYLGTWGTADRCPGTGVRVFEITDPSSPTGVGAFADHREFPGTSATTFWVGNATTDVGATRIAVVVLTPCDSDSQRRFRGLAIYDLTDPSGPTLQSTILTADSTSGPASLDIQVVEGRVIAAVAVTGSFEATSGELGDLQLYDITDLTAPDLAGHWQPPTSFPDVFSLNDPIVDGPITRVLWIDALHLVTGHESGALNVVQFISPAEVQPVRRIELAAQAPRPVNDMTLIDHHQLWVSYSEAGADIETGTGRLVDLSVDTQADVTTETTEGAGTVSSPDEAATNAVIISPSAGVSVVRVEDGVTEMGNFVPAPGLDPQRWWSAEETDTTSSTWEVVDEEESWATMVWDVATQGDFAYVSDHHTGIWIFSLPRIGDDPVLPG